MKRITLPKILAFASDEMTHQVEVGPSDLGTAREKSRSTAC